LGLNAGFWYRACFLAAENDFSVSMDGQQMRTQLWIVTVFSLIAVPAFAQSTDDRVRLSFGAGVTAGAIDGEASITASAGYRFVKNVSFEVEFTAADESANRFAIPVFGLGNIADFGRAGDERSIRNVGLQNVVRSLPPLGTFPVPIEGFDDGSTLMMTAGFRYEIPFEGTRFRPYVSGGMGLARTEETINLALATTVTTSAAVGRAGANVTSSTNTFPGFDGSFSHTGVMASAGVGASLRVFKGLSVDLNARYFRLDRDRNLGTFGGGLSYRF
jgi:Outer membrane protein beta-barrel domain